MFSYAPDNTANPARQQRTVLRFHFKAAHVRGFKPRIMFDQPPRPTMHWAAATIGCVSLLLLLYVWFRPAYLSHHLDIFDAIEIDDFQRVRTLVQKHLDVVASRNKDRMTPLHAAADLGRAEIVDFLLRKGSDVNAIDAEGNTPLHVAAESEGGPDRGCGGKEEVLSKLIAQGADVRWADISGAVVRGCSKVVALLLTKSQPIDINATDAEGMTLLHHAARTSDVNVAEELISRGANVRARDSNGWTPLHMAACGGSIVMARLLLARGADPLARDKYGNSPLGFANGTGFTINGLTPAGQGACGQGYGNKEIAAFLGEYVHNK
jgi:ankyrin repeat protein